MGRSGNGLMSAPASPIIAIMARRRGWLNRNRRRFIAVWRGDGDMAARRAVSSLPIGSRASAFFIFGATVPTQTHRYSLTTIHNF